MAGVATFTRGGEGKRGTCTLAGGKTVRSRPQEKIAVTVMDTREVGLRDPWSVNRGGVCTSARGKIPAGSLGWPYQPIIAGRHSGREEERKKKTGLVRVGGGGKVLLSLPLTKKGSGLVAFRRKRRRKKTAYRDCGRGGFT